MVPLHSGDLEGQLCYGHASVNPPGWRARAGAVMEVDLGSFPPTCPPVAGRAGPHDGSTWFLMVSLHSGEVEGQLWNVLSVIV